MNKVLLGLLLGAVLGAIDGGNCMVHAGSALDDGGHCRRFYDQRIDRRGGGRSLCSQGQFRTSWDLVWTCRGLCAGFYCGLHGTATTLRLSCPAASWE